MIRSGVWTHDTRAAIYIRLSRPAHTIVLNTTTNHFCGESETELYSQQSSLLDARFLQPSLCILHTQSYVIVANRLQNAGGK